MLRSVWLKHPVLQVAALLDSIRKNMDTEFGRERHDRQRIVEAGMRASYNNLDDHPQVKSADKMALELLSQSENWTICSKKCPVEQITNLGHCDVLSESAHVAKNSSQTLLR